MGLVTGTGPSAADVPTRLLALGLKHVRHRPCLRPRPRPSLPYYRTSNTKLDLATTALFLTNLIDPLSLLTVSKTILNQGLRALFSIHLSMPCGFPPWQRTMSRAPMERSRPRRRRTSSVGMANPNVTGTRLIRAFQLAVGRV